MYTPGNGGYFVNSMNVSSFVSYTRPSLKISSPLQPNRGGFMSAGVPGRMAGAANKWNAGGGFNQGGYVMQGGMQAGRGRAPATAGRQPFPPAGAGVARGGMQQGMRQPQVKTVSCQCSRYSNNMYAKEYCFAAWTSADDERPSSARIRRTSSHAGRCSQARYPARCRYCCPWTAAALCSRAGSGRTSGMYQFSFVIGPYGNEIKWFSFTGAEAASRRAYLLSHRGDVRNER